MKTQTPSASPGAGELLARLERFGVRLGLEVTRELLARFDDPQRDFPVVLVGGTNGKGSCAALLASMATAAGYRTGLYTSPHLQDVRERIRIDGRAVDLPAFSTVVREVMAAATSAPTYFEALTVTALVLFARRGVDLAVLEVGLGGRLDATNATEPVLSLVTDLALDHVEHLGPDLPAIAREKAGILRPGRTALTAATGAGREALAEAAAAIGAPLVSTRERVAVEVDGRSLLQGGPVRLRTRRRVYELWMPLAGEHQLTNLGLAVAAAEELGGLGFSRLSPAAVAAGSRGCRWPGRLETVPAGKGRLVLLDGAHNPSGASSLASFLAASEPPWDLLFGALADKDAAGMLRALEPVTRRRVLTAPSTSRATPAESLLPLIPELEVGGPPAVALDRFLEAPARLVVTGSLYLVGEVRGLLRQRLGRPAPAVALSTWEPLGSVETAQASGS